MPPAAQPASRNPNAGSIDGILSGLFMVRLLAIKQYGRWHAAVANDGLL
jgi:hypothetical protein